MKPKEYIKKFNFQNGFDKSKQKEFLRELAEELFATYELFDKPDDENIFDDSVDMIKQKWNSISKKIPYGLSDGLWNYFYATIIVPMKNKVCPTFVKQRKFKEESERKEREIKEARKREWREEWDKSQKGEERKFHEKILEGFAAYFEFFSSDFGNAMFGNLFDNNVVVPEDSFIYFGLTSTASEEELMQKYHEKILKVHPDRGGNKDQAVECIENKNKCLQYIKNR